MIVGGQTRACFNYHRLSSTIIVYHAPFDRGFTDQADTLHWTDSWWCPLISVPIFIAKGVSKADTSINPIQTRGGGGQLWRFLTSKPLKLWPPNLVTFTWEHFDISFPCPSTLTFSWQPYFDRHVLPNYEFFHLFIGNFQFFNVISTFLY